ncbi:MULTISPECIES: dihydroxyacetone kinase subunit DhaK [Clostridium]|uniref:dihydroxyacetone kinase subunit DhaK n=1 Tax=Clostridium TaxID=1485 RepID=UPI0008271DB4|nr:MULTISPECIES: dihydroxyacetone kinase subunit DhaK [Clostridium]PJI09170.1 dihydroxyacetone kinase [Clostridium sp. CT7]
MKKIINNPQNVVIEMCKGIALAHPELKLNTKYKIFKRRQLNVNKVSLISGGGSGHEPAHVGFVGKGMLDAAVCGDVFASPSQMQVYKAITETASNKGTLLIIKNYSGDMMNFRNAAYLAEEDGITVDYIKVDDDIAVQDSLYTVGRRGVAGTVFVHKIVGAAAERGMELTEVKRIARKAVNNVKSLGFAFSSCTVPAKGTPTFELAESDMEYGVGIHGEPGIKREKVLTADELAKRITGALVKELKLNKEDEAAILVNGFGSTPLQELYILNNAVYKELQKNKIKAPRILVGNFMTSIDMEGASVSIIKLDEELKELLSDSCDTPALKINTWNETLDEEIIQETCTSQKVTYEVETDNAYSVIKDKKITLENIIYMVDCMSECIIRNEVPFCELDSHAGDGDFGMSVAKGFRQLKVEWKEIINQNTENIGDFLNACSMVIMEYCGGASGPIWGSAFRMASKCVGNKTKLNINEFAGMIQAAVEGIQATGKRSFGRGAVVGDKTLIDALVPCANALSELSKSSEEVHRILKEAAKEAVDGAKATEMIVAHMGRAGTVGERSLGYPDAGAYALGVIFTEVADRMK